MSRFSINWHDKLHVCMLSLVSARPKLEVGSQSMSPVLDIKTHVRVLRPADGPGAIGRHYELHILMRSIVIATPQLDGSSVGCFTVCNIKAHVWVRGPPDGTCLCVWQSRSLCDC